MPLFYRTDEDRKLDFERRWRLFPTTENLRRMFGFFTYYLNKHVSGLYDNSTENELKSRRSFIKEMAFKILAWFSLFKKDMVDGEYFFDGIEERLRVGIIDKVNNDQAFEESDYKAFAWLFDQLNGPFGYMVEVNGNSGVADGVQNGGHIFRGIHVTGLPGGTVFEVMRELYQVYGGPYIALESKSKVYLTNSDGGNINKLRMQVMKYIDKLENETKFEFPIEVKVSGDMLEVIPRGANPKARAKKSKRGEETKKTSE